MYHYFSSESVSEGHPDKVADQISDKILDNFLALDPNSKVACEVLVTTNTVIVSAEIKSTAEINFDDLIREKIKDIGYDKSDIDFDYRTCKILKFIKNQSEDIHSSIEKEKKIFQGAGDQGIMFGYATDETESFMPLTLDLSHKILKELSFFRKKNNQISYLRPDSKSQVTVMFDNELNPIRISSIILSTQHEQFDSDKKMLNTIKKDVLNILIPHIANKYPEYKKYLLDESINFYINPSGKFVIGGPHGDTGLTGRKIIVDTYGGAGRHGGGAFSGKDSTKVDRSAAYMSRYIAKNIVAAEIAKKCEIQIGYAIGEHEPTSLYVNTFSTCNYEILDYELAKIILDLFDLSPYGIEKKLKLRNPIYEETSIYGHFGRKPEIVTKFFNNNGLIKKLKVKLFPWEELDPVMKLKKCLSNYEKKS